MSKEIKEEHKIACVYCQCRENLIMVAHRRQNLIVGWLFVCIDHFHQIKGKELIVDILEDGGKNEQTEESAGL